MHRRQLAQRALAGAAIAAALPVAAKAAVPREENIVFSAADPGHWAGVESLHVPETTVAGGVLTIRTPHPMSQPHYIVSHSVVLADGKFLDRKTFTWTDEPVSTHTLPAGYAGPVVITSTCNLHDFWVKRITV
jgi:superoxide reductase